MTNLVPLTAADIAEVMRIERLPGYSNFIGGFTREEHLAELASPDARYVGFRDGAGLSGFVIFQNFRQSRIRLRRIAVAEPGRGTGAELFRAAIDWAFAESSATGVWLHVRPDNVRARGVYLKHGFTEDRAAEHAHHLSIARERWHALRQAGADKT